MGKHILGSLIIIVIFLSTHALTTQASPKLVLKQKYYWHGHELPPEPHKGYYELLKNCINVLSDKCGAQMFDYIFDKRIEINYVCCRRLIEMGKECHEKLSYTLSNMKDFEQRRGLIDRKSKDAFQHCAHIDRCVAENW